MTKTFVTPVIFSVIKQPGRNPQVNHARAVKEYSRSSADQVGEISKCFFVIEVFLNGFVLNFY